MARASQEIGISETGRRPYREWNVRVLIQRSFSSFDVRGHYQQHRTAADIQNSGIQLCNLLGNIALIGCPLVGDSGFQRSSGSLCSFFVRKSKDGKLFGSGAG